MYSKIAQNISHSTMGFSPKNSYIPLILLVILVISLVVIRL